MLKTELVRHPKAFIIPMSRIRSDKVRENKKTTTNTPIIRFRIVTKKMNCEKT